MSKPSIHMSKLRCIILAAFMVLIAADASAYYRRAAIRDSLYRELPYITNPHDSLSVLLDILDLSDWAGRAKIVRQVFALAQETHNITVQLEMLQRMSNLYTQYTNHDSLFRRCEQLTTALPESSMQRATLVFIDMIRMTANSQLLSDSTRSEFFRKEIMNYRGDDESSLGEQIRHHYAVMMFIGGRTRYPMRAGNIDHLAELIRKLPLEMENVRTLFFTQAAIVYTKLGEKQRAVSMDREMISSMKQLGIRYKAQNRKYQSYLINVYYCMRRMMMNYQALAPGEADSIYSQAHAIALEVPDVGYDMQTDGRIEAFYRMARGDDAGAIEILLEQMDNPAHEPHRNILLAELVHAAQRTGDREALMRAMPAYIADMEARYNTQSLSDAIDREALYLLSDYQRSKEQSDREFNHRRDRLHSIIVISAVILTIVLLTLIILLYRLYTRSKRLSRSLKQSNEALTVERDKLKRSERDLITARDRANQASAMKSDFINNMSREVTAPLSAIVEYSQFIVDNMEEGQRKYMEKFADVVTLSADLLQTLINDALDSSAIEKSEVELTRRPIGVDSICNMAVANFRRRMKPGVSLVFEPGEPDRESIITTDPQRVEQVIINLLSNAAKFTEEGTVTLSYEFNPEHTEITFAVTDTGIGIPEGKEEIIFGRFEKLDPHTQGSGLGLYISQLISRLLGGDLRVDTTYTDGGARFLFTLPV